MYVWKWSVKSTRIKSNIFVSSKGVLIYQLKYLQLQQKENNRCVYEGKNAFLWQPTGFGKLVGYEMLSCVLDYKQSELGTGLSSYAVVLLV